MAIIIICCTNVISRSSFWKYNSRRCARQRYSWNSSTIENVKYQCQCKHELSISVRVNASKTKGIRVFSHKEYLSMLG